MNRPQRAGAFLLLSAAVVSTSQCAYPDAVDSDRGRQDIFTGNVGVRSLRGPKLEGKAEGRPVVFKYEGQNMRDTIPAHPAPEVWLSFPVTEGKDPTPSDDGLARAVRVELPPEAKRLINSQWSRRLAYEYDWYFSGAADTQARVDLSVRIAQVSQQTALQLRKVSIEAPDGRRFVSMNEVNSLASFINKGVIELIEQARERLGAATQRVAALNQNSRLSYPPCLKNAWETRGLSQAAGSERLQAVG